MKTLVFSQFIPVSLEEAWNFFSSPSNLSLITPENLNFKTISDVPDKIFEGLLIRYRIKPLLNIPIVWVTQITSLKEKEFFVDEQLKGPYKTWRHEHRFKSVNDGVMMTDYVTYDIGLGPLGKLAGKLWVDQQVLKIFTYRSEKLKILFDKKI